MRIQWNSDAIESIIRQLADAEAELSACGGNAARVREALAEANPAGDDKRLNTITERFETAMARLERLKDELDETVRDAQRANERFMEAELKNKKLVTRLDGQRTDAEDYIKVVRRFPIRATVPQRPWKVPSPRIMPDSYNAWRIGVPEWLTQLLREYNIDTRI